MNRAPTPYAAIAVVALTSLVFVYFSCSGSKQDSGAGTESADQVESFGKDLPESAETFDPADAGLKAVLASNCSDITEGSAFCSDYTDQAKIGK